ncbi:hypothetical protein PHJA_000847900, partial [Phtheirospermum japonicum]
NWAGAARTQAPSATNYDVGSTTWADLRRAPLRSAMEVTNLGHGPFRSPIDPVQVSEQSTRPPPFHIPARASLEKMCLRCGTLDILFVWLFGE